MIFAGDNMNSHIYLYRYANDTEANFQKALAHFMHAERILLEPTLLRNQQNKPYFAGNPFYLSKAHTDDYHFVAFSLENLSIDFQDQRLIDTQKMSARFFTDDEKLWLNNQDPLAFYHVWTAKEAVIKYYSQNIEDVIDTFSTLKLLKKTDPDFCLRTYQIASCFGAVLAQNPFELSPYIIKDNGIIEKEEIKESDYALR